MKIKRMEKTDIHRIAEIDRSEQVTLSYVYEAGGLRTVQVDWDVPRWFSQGAGEHSVEAQIRARHPYLENDGVLVGAFDGDVLVGFAILRPKLTETMVELAALHVSRDYRRQGLGTRLTEKIIKMAREMGAKALYASATPSESAVGFYLNQGFELTKEVNKELYAKEPEDIHLIKPL